MGFDIGGGLIGSVFGPVGTIAGGFGGDVVNGIMNPDTGTYKAPGVSAAGEKNANNVYDAANQGSTALAKQMMQGTDQGSQAFDTAERIQQKATASGMDPSVLQAIQNRQKQSYGQNLASLQAKTGLQAQTKIMDYQQKAAQLSAQRTQMDMEQQAREAQMRMDRYNMRNQVVGDILGGVASIGGAAAGMA